MSASTPGGKDFVRSSQEWWEQRQNRMIEHERQLQQISSSRTPSMGTTGTMLKSAAISKEPTSMIGTIGKNDATITTTGEEDQEQKPLDSEGLKDEQKIYERLVKNRTMVSTRNHPGAVGTTTTNTITSSNRDQRTTTSAAHDNTFSPSYRNNVYAKECSPRRNLLRTAVVHKEAARQILQKTKFMTSEERREVAEKIFTTSTNRNDRPLTGGSSLFEEHHQSEMNPDPGLMQQLMDEVWSLEAALRTCEQQITNMLDNEPKLAFLAEIERETVEAREQFKLVNDQLHKLEEENTKVVEDLRKAEEAAKGYMKKLEGQDEQNAKLDADLRDMVQKLTQIDSDHMRELQQVRNDHQIAIIDLDQQHAKVHREHEQKVLEMHRVLAKANGENQQLITKLQSEHLNELAELRNQFQQERMDLIEFNRDSMQQIEMGKHTAILELGTKQERERTKQVNDLEEKLLKQESRILADQVRVKELERKLAGYEESETAVGGAASGTIGPEKKKLLDAQKEKIEKLEEEITRLQTALSESQKALEDERKEHKEHKKDSEKKHSHHGGEMAELKEKIKELEARLAKQEEDLRKELAVELEEQEREFEAHVTEFQAEREAYEKRHEKILKHQANKNWKAFTYALRFEKLAFLAQEDMQNMIGIIKRYKRRNRRQSQALITAGTIARNSAGQKNRTSQIKNYSTTSGPGGGGEQIQEQQLSQSATEVKNQILTAGQHNRQLAMDTESVNDMENHSTEERTPRLGRKSYGSVDVAAVSGKTSSSNKMLKPADKDPNSSPAKVVHDQHFSVLPRTKSSSSSSSSTKILHSGTRRSYVDRRESSSAILQQQQKAGGGPLREKLDDFDVDDENEEAVEDDGLRENVDTTNADMNQSEGLLIDSVLQENAALSRDRDDARKSVKSLEEKLRVLENAQRKDERTAVEVYSGATRATSSSSKQKKPVAEKKLVLARGEIPTPTESETHSVMSEINNLEVVHDSTDYQQNKQQLVSSRGALREGAHRFARRNSATSSGASSSSSKDFPGGGRLKSISSGSRTKTTPDANNQSFLFYNDAVAAESSLGLRTALHDTSTGTSTERTAFFKKDTAAAPEVEALAGSGVLASMTEVPEYREIAFPDTLRKGTTAATRDRSRSSKMRQPKTKVAKNSGAGGGASAATTSSSSSSSSSASRSNKKAQKSPVDLVLGKNGNYQDEKVEQETPTSRIKIHSHPPRPPSVLQKIWRSFLQWKNEMAQPLEDEFFALSAQDWRNSANRQLIQDLWNHAEEALIALQGQWAKELLTLDSQESDALHDWREAKLAKIKTSYESAWKKCFLSTAADGAAIAVSSPCSGIVLNTSMISTPHEQVKARVCGRIAEFKQRMGELSSSSSSSGASSLKRLDAAAVTTAAARTRSDPDLPDPRRLLALNRLAWKKIAKRKPIELWRDSVLLQPAVDDFARELKEFLDENISCHTEQNSTRPGSAAATASRYNQHKRLRRVLSLSKSMARGVEKQILASDLPASGAASASKSKKRKGCNTSGRTIATSSTRDDTALSAVKLKDIARCCLVVATFEDVAAVLDHLEGELSRTIGVFFVKDRMFELHPEDDTKMQRPSSHWRDLLFYLCFRAKPDVVFELQLVHYGMKSADLRSGCHANGGAQKEETVWEQLRLLHEISCAGRG
ncbi:unnamed protein product [Amoebophrya sp. A120]|nr:unnamed protein product [Amoebophrya sp. A120]|eukprot:GSA120T00013382001.1